MAKYSPRELFIWEHTHCGKKWNSTKENSKCRACGVMVYSPYKALVERNKSKEEFIHKFSEVFK